jgi:DNA-binding FadR family transcriptional regulator
MDIAQSLRVRIAAAEWQATQRLPNERDLSEHYGVARNTVRRAISVLSDEGLVSREVGRGTLINETAPQGVGDLSVIVQKLTEISPYDMMNMRLIIEPQAAAAAAIHASDAEIAALEGIHAQALDVTDMLDYEKLDLAFHQMLFVVIRNDFLKNLNDILVILRRRPSVIAIRRNSFSEERRVECNAQHAAILGALKARDPQLAAESMKLHLSVRSRNIFGGEAFDPVPAI